MVINQERKLCFCFVLVRVLNFASKLTLRIIISTLTLISNLALRLSTPVYDALTVTNFHFPSEMTSKVSTPLRSTSFLSINIMKVMKKTLIKKPDIVKIQSDNFDVFLIKTCQELKV